MPFCQVVLIGDVWPEDIKILGKTLTGTHCDSICNMENEILKKFALSP